MFALAKATYRQARAEEGELGDVLCLGFLGGLAASESGPPGRAPRAGGRRGAGRVRQALYPPKHPPCGSILQSIDACGQAHRFIAHSAAYTDLETP